MRACVVVTIGWLVVGCYRPPTEAHCSVACGADGACPSGLACNAGGICSPGAVACETAAMDANEGGDIGPPGDASLACNRFTSEPTVILQGDSYTHYGENSAHWISNDGGDIVARRGIMSSKVAAGYFQPRMAPDGNEILMVNAAGGMFRVTWNGTTWTQPASVAVDALVVPGTMTNSTPREMIATEAGRLVRGVEAGGAWFFTEVGTLGFAQATDASVDPTGTRLVFVGASVDDGARAIYLAAADPGSATGWSQPELLYDHAGEETTPFLTADCKQLTFSVDGDTYLLE